MLHCQALIHGLLEGRKKLHQGKAGADDCGGCQMRCNWNAKRMRRYIRTDVPGVRRGEGKGAKGVGQHSCVSTSCRIQKYTVLVYISLLMFLMFFLVCVSSLEGRGD